MPNIWIILIKSSTVTSSSYFAYWMKYDFYYLQQRQKNHINGSEAWKHSYPDENTYSQTDPLLRWLAHRKPTKALETESTKQAGKQSSLSFSFTWETSQWIFSATKGCLRLETVWSNARSLRHSSTLGRFCKMNFGTIFGKVIVRFRPVW